jgi:hypothetical protein
LASRFLTELEYKLKEDILEWMVVLRLHMAYMRTRLIDIPLLVDVLRYPIDKVCCLAISIIQNDLITFWCTFELVM